MENELCVEETVRRLLQQFRMQRMARMHASGQGGRNLRLIKEVEWIELVDHVRQRAESRMTHFFPSFLILITLDGGANTL